MKFKWKINIWIGVYLLVINKMGIRNYSIILMYIFYMRKRNIFVKIIYCYKFRIIIVYIYCSEN